MTMSWNGQVALRSPDGQPVPLEAWVDAALAGRWDDVERTLGPVDAAPAGVAAPPVAPPAGSPLPPPPTASPATAAERPTLPEPPMPPFEPADGEWRFRGDLPGLFGSKTWLISDTALSVDGERIEFADVATFSFKFEGAAVGSGLSAKIRINGTGGEKLKASMQTMSGKGKETTVSAVMYLWELLAATAGEHLRNGIVARVRAGETVEVAKLYVSSAGISGDKNGKRLLPWAQVHDPRIDGGNVVVLAETSALTIPISNENAFLLPGLVPELRVRFG